MDTLSYQTFWGTNADDTLDTTGTTVEASSPQAAAGEAVAALRLTGGERVLVVGERKAWLFEVGGLTLIAGRL